MWWLWLFACVPSDEEVYVAHDDLASVGLTLQDGRMTAYVCGNQTGNRAEWSRWFEGRMDDGVFSLERDDWTLSGSVDQVELMSPDGLVHPWSVSLAVEGGLYEHEDRCRDGAILGLGEVNGTVCGSVDGVFQVDPADTLRPADSLQLIGGDGLERTFRRLRP